MIKINEDAAKADMNRIDQAIPILQNALDALNRVQSQGQQTQGATGSAIVEKSGELIYRINALNETLTSLKTNINQTVIEFQEYDAQKATEISNAE